MNDVQMQMALSAVRTLLAIAGGALVAHGYVNDATVSEAIGAIMTLIPLAWGMINKAITERNSQARAVQAYNAGATQMPMPDKTTQPTQGVKP
jgi:hypothetical protein